MHQHSLYPPRDRELRKSSSYMSFLINDLRKFFVRPAETGCHVGVENENHAYGIQPVITN